jgi:hypothetical protein
MNLAPIHYVVSSQSWDSVNNLLEKINLEKTDFRRDVLLAQCLNENKNMEEYHKVVIRQKFNLSTTTTNDQRITISDIYVKYLNGWDSPQILLEENKILNEVNTSLHTEILEILSNIDDMVKNLPLLKSSMDFYDAPTQSSKFNL